ncbi:MAG: NUDIX domain-containing protein [bacterium]|nr:NUDIX domain-containing protein [bacterium]
MHVSRHRHTAVPAVYALFEQEGRYLFMLRKGSGYFDGWYGVPSGHVEPEELPVAGLLREVHEEIGITLRVDDVEFVHTLYRAAEDATGERVDFFFRVRQWSGSPRICEPHKCDALAWLSPDALPPNVMPFIVRVLRSLAEGKFYDELSFATR